MTISQFAQRLCQTSGGEKSAEENGDGVVKHEKGNKAEEHKMECAQQKEGGVSRLLVIGEHRAPARARVSLSIDSLGATAGPHIPEGRA